MIFLFSIIYFLIPHVSSAAFEGASNLLTGAGNVIGLLIPLAFGLSVLFFFWGVAKFILTSGDPKAKQQGKNIMVWGVIAIFVISSIWGIVGFINTAIFGNNSYDTVCGDECNN